MPQGPTHAVRPSLVIAIHLPGPSTPGGTDGSRSFAGWPDRILAGSAIGPFGVINLGEWQSLQPPTIDKYLPRSIGFLPVLAVWAKAAPGVATRSIAAASIFQIRVLSRIVLLPRTNATSSLMISPAAPQ